MCCTCEMNLACNGGLTANMAVVAALKKAETVVPHVAAMAARAPMLLSYMHMHIIQRCVTPPHC